MAKGWKADKAWADLYMLEVRRILGAVFIEAGTPEEDRKYNTDLKVRILAYPRFSLSIRIRRFGFRRHYPFDITIRSLRPSGIDTELKKISQGYGDYMMYGFAAQVTLCVPRWVILDLNHIRGCYRCNAQVSESRVKPNLDGSSSFIAVDMRHLRGCDAIYSVSERYWQNDPEKLESFSKDLYYRDGKLHPTRQRMLEIAKELGL